MSVRVELTRMLIDNPKLFAKRYPDYFLLAHKFVSLPVSDEKYADLVTVWGAANRCVGIPLPTTIDVVRLNHHLHVMMLSVSLVLTSAYETQLSHMEYYTVLMYRYNSFNYAHISSKYHAFLRSTNYDSLVSALMYLSNISFDRWRMFNDYLVFFLSILILIKLMIVTNINKRTRKYGVDILRRFER